MSARTNPAPDTRPKSVLFCPTCGHESPLHGDWLVDETDQGLTYDCPVCGGTVEERSRPLLLG